MIENQQIVIMMKLQYNWRFIRSLQWDTAVNFENMTIYTTWYTTDNSKNGNLPLVVHKVQYEI